jgi:hypothetical protein
MSVARVMRERRIPAKGPAAEAMRNTRWKLIAGFLLVAIAIVWWFVSWPSPAKRALWETERALRSEGYKVDLTEFDFSVPEEITRRVSILGRTTRADLTNRPYVDPLSGHTQNYPYPELLSLASLNAAVPAWKLSRSPDHWSELRKAVAANRDEIDAARAAAISGPIRFEPIGANSPASLLPYLGDLKTWERTFGVLTMLEIHDARSAEAWSNLLAVTCLATEYAPEPIPISHMSRLAYVEIAFDTTWNALQAPFWTGDQLGRLQGHWESLDVWASLPETVAYTRAEGAIFFRMERDQPFELGLPFKEMILSPRATWNALVSWSNTARYKARGSYEDQRAVLLHYRDREIELIRALEASTWKEMRHFFAATNTLPFVSKHSSRASVLMNLRQLGMASVMRGLSLLGRAAEAETRRRLVITALALERFKREYDQYPARLEDLVPEFLPSVPIDFMDGHPLRYNAHPDGWFELYSAGLNCIDDGGTARSSGLPESHRFGIPKNLDIVWPRPATELEIRQLEQEREVMQPAWLDKLMEDR